MHSLRGSEVVLAELVLNGPVIGPSLTSCLGLLLTALLRTNPEPLVGAHESLSDGLRQNVRIQIRQLSTLKKNPKTTQTPSYTYKLSYHANFDKVLRCSVFLASEKNPTVRLLCRQESLGPHGNSLPLSISLRRDLWLSETTAEQSGGDNAHAC